MDKSYVTMEQHVCPVCLNEHDSGAILMDTRLRDRFKHKTLTGWGLCEEHQKLADDDYVFLLEIDEEKSSQPFTLESVWRTGVVTSVRKEVAERVFDIHVNSIAFVPPEVTEILQKLASVGGDDVGQGSEGGGNHDQ